MLKASHVVAGAPRQACKKATWTSGSPLAERERGRDKRKKGEGH